LHIVYLRADDHSLKVVSQAGGVWQTPVVVDASGEVQGECCVAPQGSDLPVSYRRSGTNSLYFAGPQAVARWTSQNVTPGDPDDVGRQIATAWQPDGTLGLACRNETDGSLMRFLRDPAGSWTSVVVDPGPSRGNHADLAWREGVGFSFSEYGGGYLVLADPEISAVAWTSENATAGESDDIGTGIVEMWGPEGEPALACRNATDGSLVHLRRQPGGEWDLSVVDPGPSRGTYADLTWRPGVGFAFSEYGGGMLVLADPQITPALWTLETATLESENDIGVALTAEWGPDGELGIACRDVTDGALAHLRRSAAGEWESHVVDRGPNRGSHADLAWIPGSGYRFSEYNAGGGSLLLLDPELQGARWDTYAADGLLESGSQLSCSRAFNGRTACAYLARDPSSGVIEVRVMDITASTGFLIGTVVDSVATEFSDHVMPDVAVSSGPQWHVAYRDAPTRTLRYGSADWLGVIPTDVADPIDPLVPPESHVTELLGAGPNPSGGRLSITFSSARPDLAVVEVFDAGGRRVRHVEAACRPGQNEIRLDGSDDADAPLRGGIYIVSLRVGGRELGARKITMLR